MNVLFAVSEAAPFVKTGGLADVAGSLPKALCQEGCDCRVILPLYSSIDPSFREKMTFLFSATITLSWRQQYCGVFSLIHEGVTYYFVDNEYYFSRDRIYGCYDDGERFGYFSRAVTELLPLLGWRPDIINCNDWQTALIPLYLNREPSDFYRSIKTVFTIHNIEYQGRLGNFCLEELFGLPNELYENGVLQFMDEINLMKGAIYESDRLTTVSPSYASELMNPYFACGLHAVISENAGKLTGIINGIDTEHFDPTSDPHIPSNYGVFDMGGKKKCRVALCRKLGLDENDESPIIVCVSRLVSHKGFDLVSDALDTLMSKKLRLVILGTGDEFFENRFRQAEDKYRGRVSASIMYSEERAMLIYSGGDMLLMPSKSEPCGLSQMIAMRYGTVPIVHAVGGLRDSVRNYRTENANGFVFYDYTSPGMLGAINDAINVFSDKEAWNALRKKCMTENFSWDESAAKYLEIYNSLM